MDLKGLHYLIVLAEEGSVSKAAQRLFVAQSTLSQFLQQAEHELGVRLFQRTGRGIRPTANGMVYISRLQKIMGEYQQAKKELWSNENLEGGAVVFGISFFRGKWMLPDILQRFYRQYPDIRIRVVEQSSSRLEGLLLNGGLDLAIVAMPCSRLQNQAEFLRQDEIVIAAHRDHPVMELARWRPGAPGYWIELGDAARFEFILARPDTVLGAFGRRLMQQAGVQHSFSNDNFTADLTFSMAAQGLGLAFTYYPYARLQGNAVPLRIGREGVFLDLGIVRAPGEYRSRAADALVQVIREIYHAQPQA